MRQKKVAIRSQDHPLSNLPLHLNVIKTINPYFFVPCERVGVPAEDNTKEQLIEELRAAQSRITELENTAAERARALTILESTTGLISNTPEMAGAAVEGTVEVAGAVFEVIAEIIGGIFSAF